MSLGEPEIAIETVDQNLEGILQRLEIPRVYFIVGLFAARMFAFASRRKVRRSSASDEKSEADRLLETIELQHHGGIGARRCRNPDVARDAREIDGGESTFETGGPSAAREWNALPQVLAQKKRVMRVALRTHDHVLIIVRENLRLDEITRAE